MGLCASTEHGDYVTVDPYAGDKFLCYRHGEGTYHYSNGDTYEGRWKWDKKHGHGVYTHRGGEIKQGFFHKDDYLGEDPGDLFAVTSCFSGCFTSNAAEPLESGKHEYIGNQKQGSANKDELEQKAKDREERKKRREAMAKKYKKVPKSAGHIQDQ